jgi:uncharacterized protein involved in exopolysaccharide biosynthesis
MPPDGPFLDLGVLGRPSIMALNGPGGIAGDTLPGKSSGALFVGVLKSDNILSALVEKFQLRKVYDVSKAQDAREILAKRTSLAEDRRSGVISIEVTDRDPNRAASLAQAYVAELDRVIAQLSTSSARRERVFLEERLQKAKVDLDTAAEKFSEFASNNTAIDIPIQEKAMVEAAASLQGQLIAAQSELSGVQQTYTADHVRARATAAHVRELQESLNQIGGRGTPEDLEHDRSLYPSIRKLPLLGVRYADLYRETKIQETVYDLLTQECELAKVREAAEVPTVNVFDVAIVPARKSFPPRVAIAILGTVLGIGLSMAILVGKSKWRAVDTCHPYKVLATEVFTTLETVYRTAAARHPIRDHPR